ncbi:hypothetical protein BGZ96_000834, partial [Linnemannia gamsii]
SRWPHAWSTSKKSNVPYVIFERAAAVKPLGAGMSVGPSLLPLFEQLGIYDEFLAIGKYGTHTFNYNESLESYPPIDYSPVEEFAGYGQYIVARPKLYDLILRQLPAHKINFGHRVLNISKKEDKVTIHLANNSTFEGDIIVGADGAYSAVRQRMYEQLRVKGTLSKSDQGELPFSCTCLVDQTKVLDPEEYQIVKGPLCQFRSVFGDEQPFTTRDFSVPFGEGKNTLGHIYDLTPKEQLSKVMLEEKVFKAWHSGRIVLLGDACHKLNPAGGHGAVTAMHDAIALANLLYAMPATTSLEVAKIFEEYRKERYPAVMESFKNSQQMSMIADKGIVGSIVFYLIHNMLSWLWRLVVICK